MTGKGRCRSEDGKFLTLTKAQQDALFKILRRRKESGNIPWRIIHRARSFQSVSYEALRTEGKSILRRIKKEATSVTKKSSLVQALSKEIISLRAEIKEAEVLLSAYISTQKSW